MGGIQEMNAGVLGWRNRWQNEKMWKRTSEIWWTDQWGEIAVTPPPTPPKAWLCKAQGEQDVSDGNPWLRNYWWLFWQVSRHALQDCNPPSLPDIEILNPKGLQAVANGVYWATIKESQRRRLNSKNSQGMMWHAVSVGGSEILVESWERLEGGDGRWQCWWLVWAKWTEERVSTGHVEFQMSPGF